MNILHVRTHELNLNAVVTSLCCPDEWEVVEEFRTTVQEEKEHLYWTVGVHPRVKFEDEDKIRWGDMLKDGRCVGVGEVGLDRKKHKTPKNGLNQKHFFCHYENIWLFANPEPGVFIVMYFRSITSLQS